MSSSTSICRSRHVSLCRCNILLSLLFFNLLFLLGSAQFLEELRSVMGIPEWMLDVDARKTKELHGGACIQMIIHFKGPIAHRLELDMSRLIAAGRLDAPSLFIPGYVNTKRKATISYRTCGVRDHNEKRK